jgi:hypothetical protein
MEKQRSPNTISWRSTLIEIKLFRFQGKLGKCNRPAMGGRRQIDGAIPIPP